MLLKPIKVLLTILLVAVMFSCGAKKKTIQREKEKIEVLSLDTEEVVTKKDVVISSEELKKIVSLNIKADSTGIVTKEEKDGKIVITGAAEVTFVTEDSDKKTDIVENETVEENKTSKEKTTSEKEIDNVNKTKFRIEWIYLIPLIILILLIIYLRKTFRL